MLIKGWEAQKVKAEHDKAERERRRSQASGGGAGRTVTRTPL
jgi:hypothetical protein